MKLNGRKIHRIIGQKKKEVPSKEIARDMKVSRRRVKQVWKYYRDRGKEPIIGQNLGRPKKTYDPAEAHERFKFGARMLDVVIRKRYKIKISHNRIYIYLLAHLLARGLAGEDLKRKKRRKWVSYERKHSMSAGRIDWHEGERTKCKVCVILDDASRKILTDGSSRPSIQRTLSSL